MLLQQWRVYIHAIGLVVLKPVGELMSLIAKWTLQLVVVFLLGWIAAITASWSNSVVNGTGSDRLAQLTSARASTGVVAHDATLAASGG